MSWILPHIQPFNLLSIVLNLKDLPRLLPIIYSGESSLRKLRSSSLKITRRLKWLTLSKTQHLFTLDSSHLLFWTNLMLNPSKFTFMTNSSPDNTPQDVDRSCHLSDSISTTDSLDESSTLSVPDDTCFNWILPASHLNCKTHLD